MNESSHTVGEHEGIDMHRITPKGLQATKMEEGQTSSSQTNHRTRVRNSHFPLPKVGVKQRVKTYIKQCMNKGTISNLVTFVIMIIGILLVTLLKKDKRAGEWILSFGLFGFAGGITNWLAVKMLFDRIPFLIGSGVIPRRFKEIRQVVKDTIMRTFFDKEYLNEYMHKKMSQITASFDIDEKVRALLDSPQVDEIIEKNLVDLSKRPEGMWMTMMGLTPSSLKPMIKPFILGLASHIGPLLMELMTSSDTVSVDAVRQELDRVMTEKLQELTPERVKQLMEDVIRDHLGWLIVWGNLFGGVIGLVAKAAGY